MKDRITPPAAAKLAHALKRKYKICYRDRRRETIVTGETLAAFLLPAIRPEPLLVTGEEILTALQMRDQGGLEEVLMRLGPLLTEQLDAYGRDPFLRNMPGENP